MTKSSKVRDLKLMRKRSDRLRSSLAQLEDILVCGCGYNVRLTVLDLKPFDIDRLDQLSRRFDFPRSDLEYVYKVLDIPLSDLEHDLCYKRFISLLAELCSRYADTYSNFLSTERSISYTEGSLLA